MSADQPPTADPTPSLSRVDVAGLRAAAEAATPGPWRSEYSGSTGPVVLDAESHNALDHVAKCCHYRAGLDAAFIAAANPATVLALLDERDDLATRLATIEAEIERLAASWDAESTRYRRYATGSSIPEVHRSIAKTLRGNAGALRAAYERPAP